MVQINFQWGKNDDGSRFSIPNVAIDTFHLKRRSEHIAVYHPTWGTLWKSLAVTVLMAIFMGILYYLMAPVVFSPPVSRTVSVSPGDVERMRDAQESLAQDFIEQGVLTEEDVDRIEEESRERVTRERDRLATLRGRVTGTAAPIFWGLMSVFAAVALIAPLSTLWRTIRISRDVNLRPKVAWINMMGWPSTHHWDRGALSYATIVAQEEQEKRNRHDLRTVGWRWIVTIHGAQGEPRVVFRCMRQPHRPMEDRYLPPSVKELVYLLERLWDVRCDQRYAVVDVQRTERGFFGTKRTFSSSPRLRRSETVQTYTNLDEMPPELQAKARAMMEEARRTGQPVHSEVTSREVRRDGEAVITFRGSDGEERTYPSIDAMPPAIRAEYEEVMRMLGE